MVTVIRLRTGSPFFARMKNLIPEIHIFSTFHFLLTKL